jgi:hypothetical protein
MKRQSDTGRDLRTAPLDTDFYSITDLAHISRESPSVWLKRIRRGLIPHVKFGRNVRVSHRDFEEFVASRRVAAR